jgi:hypothetical protein
VPKSQGTVSKSHGSVPKSQGNFFVLTPYCTSISSINRSLAPSRECARDSPSTHPKLVSYNSILKKSYLYTLRNSGHYNVYAEITVLYIYLRTQVIICANSEENIVPRIAQE